MFSNRIYFNDKKYFIRALKEKDINQNYLKWFANKNNTKFIVNSNFTNLKDLKKYYKKQIKEKNIFLGIFNSKTLNHIGNIKFQNVDIKKKEAFVGIFLGNINYQNQNVGSKSIITACDLIYKKLKIFKIYLGVRKNNHMAINSYKSAGFYVCKIKKNKFIMLRNYFLNKIIIGTANFEDDYGIVAGKKITNKEKNKIFSLSNKFNISTYDLSDAYNLNLISIKKSIPKDSKIYLKLLKNYKNFNFKKILRLKNHFKKIINFLMIHGFKGVIDINNKKTIGNLKKISKISPLGISVYEPSEIYKADKLFSFKSAQVPVNIFDQRFLSLRMISFFKKNNIQFCARSIYLQGVLLQNKSFIKKKFPQFSNDFEKFFSVFKNNYNKKKQILTHFIFQNKNIDKVVVGFENSKQLEDLIKILNDFHNLEEINFFKLKVNKLKLIDPTKWIIK